MGEDLSPLDLAKRKFKQEIIGQDIENKELIENLQKFIERKKGKSELRILLNK